MKRGLKVTKEQIFVSVIGFFVGRAVCFEMNPLAAAFWAAAQIEGVGGVWLFLAMLLGVLSAQSVSGGITFTVFAFLFFIYMAYNITQVFSRQDLIFKLFSKF